MPKRDYSREGSAAGAAIGTAFMPGVGTAIGGALGGVVGGLITSGHDPGPPPDLTAPISPGGVIGDYGGVMRDPYTGLVTYTNNDFGTGNYDLLRNAYLQDLLMGGTGASATNDLDAQIQFQQQILDRLSNPASSGSANLDITKYVGKEWIDPKTGQVYSSEVRGDPNSIDRNSALFQKFLADTGGNYGSKNRDISFGKWLKDAYSRNVQPKITDFENAQKSVQGNQVVGAEAIKAAQLKLQQLQQARAQFTGQQAGLANNPYLNYLNKATDPRYQSDIDRWRGQADLDYARMGQKPELPFNTADDWTVAGFDKFGNRVGPDGSTANASMDLSRGEYRGPDSGDYSMLDARSASALGDVLSRNAENIFQNANIGRDQQMANRGLLSSSVNEVARAGDVARLADAQAQARLGGFQAYNDVIGKNNQTASQKFQDQFNSAMARAQTGQWRFNAQQNQDNALYNRALGIDQTRYGRQNNELNLRNQLEQQWRQNALQSLGVQGGLEDRLQGRERQNFADRMGFSEFLANQSQRNFQNELQRRGMNLNQTGQGLNMNMQMAGAQTNQALANQQMQNSWQNASNQMAGSRDAANSQFFGNLMGNVATAYTQRQQSPYLSGQQTPQSGVDYSPVGSGPRPTGMSPYDTDLASGFHF
jgi:hypothetical protein